MSKNSATYTNHPSRVAKSRMQIDANEIMTQDETLKFERNYYQFNVENTIDTHYKMLITGRDCRRILSFRGHFLIISVLSDDNENNDTRWRCEKTSQSIYK